MPNDINGTDKPLENIVEQVSSSAAMRAAARSLIREGAKRAELYKAAIRPIWGATAEGRPVHIGSCVLLNIGGERIILTAAHVVDWASLTTLYLGLADLIALPDAFETSIAPSGDRDLDVMDYAAMRFPSNLLPELGDATFIPESAIGSRDPIDARYFTCIGFPNSQNRTPPRTATAVRNRQRSYTNRGRTADKLPGRAQSGVHVLVDFNFKFSRNSDGERVSSGKPNGMSGGAIFDIGALGTLNQIRQPEQARLAALFIEGHHTEKVVMGTRIEHILADLRAKGWLAASLPL